MGVTSIGYSWYYKMPILMAWSTPGAAILVSSASQYSLPALVAAFAVTGLLIFVTGLISPLSKALQRIPSPLATAMLAAILLPFCVKAFEPVMTMPIIFGVMFSAYLVSKRFVPKYTMLILLLIGLFFAFQSDQAALSTSVLKLAKPNWVTPQFDLSTVLNISIPLYIVTMLSQNLPGIAMMRSYQYQAPVKPILLGTGITNLLSAPFGGLSLNLAAISAALCMTEDVDRDKNVRYKTVLWAGGFYLVAGILASSVVALFVSLPLQITHMLAGFALLGTLLMCLQTAFQSDDLREPALLTFLVTLSGMSLLGISSTLWGLLVGGLYVFIMRKRKSD
ncbi:benzoate/H(+) symporter BenE family transporter [Vibrio sp. Hep-1b-8]|uniref:benzoate/H(+) symporter BenE family transporter n=1 Tax=Vibrio sp. Hep-1b-8 TaxID=2144187 RepID=UPI001110A2F6|nr:benzoate/H(+) symporter BenE family transporter [Vibrio sp. Hep-1b-8]TMX35720.1 benzoate transporter [Vibrio sp. Hep-1b-8]